MDRLGHEGSHIALMLKVQLRDVINFGQAISDPIKVRKNYPFDRYLRLVSSVPVSSHQTND